MKTTTARWAFSILEFGKRRERKRSIRERKKAAEVSRERGAEKTREKNYHSPLASATILSHSPLSFLILGSTPKARKRSPPLQNLRVSGVLLEGVLKKGASE